MSDETRKLADQAETRALALSGRDVVTATLLWRLRAALMGLTGEQSQRNGPLVSVEWEATVPGPLGALLPARRSGVHTGPADSVDGLRAALQSRFPEAFRIVIGRPVPLDAPATSRAGTGGPSCGDFT